MENLLLQGYTIKLEDIKYIQDGLIRNGIRIAKAAILKK